MARRHHLDGADIGVADVRVWADAMRPRSGLEDLDAVSDTDRNFATHLQRDQRLTHRSPADAQPLGKVTLSREERAHRKHALVDAVADKGCNLPVKPHRLDLRQAQAGGGSDLPAL